jgi:hypothetical protein
LRLVPKKKRTVKTRQEAEAGMKTTKVCTTN